MNAIEIQGLCKTYPGFSLQNISLTLPQGCILGLVGENGAGKSTLMKLTMNAVAKESGSVKVLGVDVQSPQFDAVKEEIGVVLDEAYFPESLTAQRVGHVMRHTFHNWQEDCYQGYLDKLSLPRDKLFKDFSKGMRRKLAIAVALSHQPKLLILDEATGGLDPMVRDEMLDLFRDFTREESHSILLSSHILSDLEKCCDYIAFLHRGKLLLCQEKDRLLEEYGMVKLSQQAFEALPEEAVQGVRRTAYGVEALVRKDQISPAFPVEHTTLEEIILFLAKGEEAQ